MLRANMIEKQATQVQWDAAEGSNISSSTPSNIRNIGSCSTAMIQKQATQVQWDAAGGSNISSSTSVVVVVSRNMNSSDI